MQFMIIPVMIAALAARLHGGRLHHLGEVQIRHAWLPLVMFSLQVWLVLFPTAHSELWWALRPWITLATYALLLAFLGANHRLPGLRLIMAGAVLNLLVLAANGGYMPVTRQALARSGHLDKIYTHAGREFVLGSKDVVLAGHETRLGFLSDVLKMPPALETPATFSPGDILIALGAAWLTYRVMRDPLVGVGRESRERAGWAG